MKLIFSFLVVFFAVSSGFAKTWQYDCGQYLNIRRTLVIQPAPQGSFYPYKAIYTTAGKNPTTGTLSAVKINLEGDIDVSSELTSKPMSTFAFTEVNRPQFQVLVLATTAVGTKVPGRQLLIKSNNPPKADIEDFVCVLAAYSN